MTYARAKIYVVAFLCAYALIGFAAHVFSNRGEDVYPFFSWFLFVTVPSREQTSFELYVVKIAGGELDHPLPISQRRDVISSNMQADHINMLVQNFGRSLQHADTASQTPLRAQLESQFVKPITYQIREITYNPIDRYNTGRISSSTVIGQFDTP